MNKPKDKLPPLNVVLEGFMRDIIVNPEEMPEDIKELCARMFYAGASAVFGSFDAICTFENEEDRGEAFKKLAGQAALYGRMAFVPQEQALEHARRTGGIPIGLAGYEIPDPDTDVSPIIH